MAISGSSNPVSYWQPVTTSATTIQRPDDGNEPALDDIGLRESGDGQVCVLLVEDDADLRRMVVDYFVQNNVQVLVARGREEMAAHLGNSEVNLVILDLRLGRENGLDLLREIRSSSRLRSTGTSARRP